VEFAVRAFNHIANDNATKEKGKIDLKRSPNGLRFDFNDFTSGEGRFKRIFPWKENPSRYRLAKMEPQSLEPI
jgi:hypothetical protein